MKIPLVFCVDVEPDARLVDRGSREPWAGYEATYAYLSDLRPRLERVTGAPVHFNWFFRMDPQVATSYGSPAWVVEHYPAFWRSLDAAGDGLGVHVHAYRWEERTGTWVIDHGNQQWVDECLEMSFAAFESAVGFPCHLSRMGDRFMNTATLSTLESLGSRYDLTLEPGKPATAALDPTEPHTGVIPGCPITINGPYRPSKERWAQADPSRRDGLIFIPLTAGYLPREWFPESWYAPLTRGVRRLLGRPSARWIPHDTLNLARPHRSMRYLIDQTLRALPRPYLACVIRSTTPAHPARRAEMERTLAYLMSPSRVGSFVVVRPDEAVDLLQGRAARP